MYSTHPSSPTYLPLALPTEDQTESETPHPYIPTRSVGGNGKRRIDPHFAADISRRHLHAPAWAAALRNTLSGSRTLGACRGGLTPRLRRHARGATTRSTAAGSERSLTHCEYACELIDPISRISSSQIAELAFSPKPTVDASPPITPALTPMAAKVASPKSGSSST